MQIEFRTAKLRRCFEEQSLAEKTWPAQVGLHYIQRIQIIQEAVAFEHVKMMKFLGVHQLQGKRTGQWAIKLTGRYRLIVELLPNNQIEVVRIIEVSNHYGD